MKRWQIFLAIIGLIVVVGYGLLAGLVMIAGSHARGLVGVLLGGYERFTMTYTESMLAHLAAMPQVRLINADSCKAMEADLKNSQGFFAVLAIGDHEGRAVCSAAATESTPLPTMSDRLYYQRVKNSHKMVVGEFAVSRTTGKQVLHFAYPIREKEQFKGFVLAAVNLEWFADRRVDEYLGGRGIEVLGVDRTGRLLYAYPHDAARVGENVVPAEMVAAMMTGTPKYKIIQGHDGEYRVYGYKIVQSEEQAEMLFLVGIGVEALRPLIVGLGGFVLLAIGVSWYGAGRVWQSRGAKSKKK